MQQNSDKRFWGIRAGKGGDAHKLFLGEKVIALADAKLGDLTKLDATRDTFYSVYRQLHPDETRTGTAGIAGKFFRFIHEIGIGDFVVYPSIIDKTYYVGEVTGEYKFMDNSDYQHQRAVRWNYSIPKDKLSKRACQELNAARTFFEFKNNTQNLIQMMNDDFIL
jgi:restriction system protein